MVVWMVSLFKLSIDFFPLLTIVIHSIDCRICCNWFISINFMCFVFFYLILSFYSHFESFQLIITKYLWNQSCGMYTIFEYFHLILKIFILIESVGCFIFSFCFSSSYNIGELNEKKLLYAQNESIISFFFFSFFTQ